MSALFISHSSADNAVADELKAQLSARGHRSMFLDFDPAVGIPAGRHWEHELYAQLRACQAVIVLCSASSMASPWCFAEITHARALGKPLFPVNVDGCKTSSLLSDVQVVQLTVTDPALDAASVRSAGWQRVIDGLAKIGLDPSAMFDWDGSRPPYPGLLAFQKEDAAVYFGRGAAIQSMIEILQRLRRLGGPRLLLLLGASGSGKSSLVRAGIAPRLERDRGNWLLTPPFRPLARPLDSLAIAMAGVPGSADWKTVRAVLAAADGWRDWVNDVRSAGGNEAGVLLLVDQLEESLGETGSTTAPDEHAAFLRLLASMTAEADGPLFVIATLRSDFLGAFQTHPALRDVVYEPIHLPQIAMAEIAQVIEGPAQVAGIALEPGLSQAMVTDTATDDALPLLAFALREMTDRFGDGVRRGEPLTIDQYSRQLGGLQGALARSAESLCDNAAGEIDALRQALLKLVRVDAEGRYVRQPRAWRELPPEVHPLLERFVQARLLVSRSEGGGERMLEVAHEALFRSWGRLAEWLAADREFLLWRERLRSGSDAWQCNRRDANLVLRGPVLVEAQRWFSERAGDLSADARDFIGASIAARDADQATRDRRRRRTTAGLVSVALVLGVLAALAGWQWRQASEQRGLALARQLNVQAAAAQARDPVLGLLLTVQSLASAWTVEGHGALLESLDTLARPQPSPWRAHPGPVRAMALSPDQRWLATAGQAQLQVQAASGEVHDLKSRNGHAYLHVLAFSPAGDRLAAACEERVVCVYDTATWQELTRLPPSDGPLSAVAFGADGRLLASSSRTSGDVRFHALPGGEAAAPIATSANGVDAMALSRDGKQLAVSTHTGLSIWDMASRKLAGEITGSGGMSIAFSPDGRLLATARTQFPLVYALTDAGDGDVKLSPQPNGSGAAFVRPFGRVGFSPDGRYVAVSDDRDGVRVLDLGLQRIVAQAPAAAGALVFQADGRLLAGGIDGRISAWDPSDKALRRFADADEVLATALSADGRQLATAGSASGVRLWDAQNGKSMQSLPLASDPNGLAFSADGRWLAVVHGEELSLAETASGRVAGPFHHEARVTGLRFEEGGQRIATTTAWDAVGNARYGIKRPTRIKVWDVATRAELGWRFDIAGDSQRAQTIAAKDSLAAVKLTEGGDSALVAKAASWPIAYAADDLNHDPQLLVPGGEWLAAKTASGTALSDLALQRARQADGVADNEGHFAFSADGKWLASAAGHEARLWPLLAADLSAEACIRLPRNLTCAEWRETQGQAPYTKTCAQRPDPPDAADCGRGIETPK